MNKTNLSVFLDHPKDLLKSVDTELLLILSDNGCDYVIMNYTEWFKQTQQYRTSELLKLNDPTTT